MAIPVYIRSLYPKSSVYMFKEETWYSVDKKQFPKFPWLSNQTGLQVAIAEPCVVNVVEDLPSLLGRLPFIVDDLIREAVSAIGLKHDTVINSLRWMKLSAPRPVPDAGVPPMAWAVRGKQTFALTVQADGRGGWCAATTKPNDAIEACKFWDYTLYIPKSYEPVKLLPCATKRIVTATLDCLYCYDLSDVVTKSYLCYAQPRMKKIWERKAGTDNATDNKGTC